MKIDAVLDELEDVVKDAWNLPLTGGKGLVNVTRMSELIRDIHDAMPNELRQANAIIADRTQIINEARSEAANIISVAEGKAKLLVERDEIVRQAQEKAEGIIMEAKVDARNTRKAASEYVDELMKKTEETLVGMVSDLRTARQGFKSSQQIGSSN